MNAREHLLVVCACLLGLGHVRAQEEPPDPAGQSIAHLQAIATWMADAHGAARQRVLERQAARLTEDRAENAAIEYQIAEQLKDLKALAAKVAALGESVEEGTATIRQSAADPAALAAESARQLGSAHEGAAAIAAELVRIEDSFDPLAEPRQPLVPPPALGEPAVGLSAAESDEVEKLVNDAIFQPWLEFQTEQSHAQSEHTRQFQRPVKSMHASVDNLAALARYDYVSYFRTGKAGEQVVDRVRGTIELQRRARIGQFGTLVSRSAVLAFRYEPPEEATTVIRGAIRILLDQPLGLDLRDLPAGSLLSRVESRQWMIQYPPGYEPPAPATPTGQPPS